jgi:protein-tyrosine phosphatase
VIQRALFVCTGNIFRSLTADMALSRLLERRAAIQVSSAGTVDYPHEVRPYTREYLLAKGFDVSGHRRRTLTQAMVDESHLVVAMSTDHQVTIRERFGRTVPLYLEVCGEAAEWLPDIEDVIPDYQTNRLAVETHVRRTIDRIVQLAPRIAVNIDLLMERYGIHKNDGAGQ